MASRTFRPIDLALSYDGKTMYVADWNMGGWGNKQEKVGRVFAITYKDEIKTRPRGKDSDPVEDQIKQLDHPSFNERMRAQAVILKKPEAGSLVLKTLDDPKTDAVARRHLIWIAAQYFDEGRVKENRLLPYLKSPLADLRAQTARAFGLRFDLHDHEEELNNAGGRGFPDKATLVTALIPLLADPEPSVRLQAVIALKGRIRDAKAITALLPSTGREGRLPRLRRASGSATHRRLEGHRRRLEIQRSEGPRRRACHDGDAVLDRRRLGTGRFCG